MAQNDVRLKLLIDMKGKKVVFAEADKNVVDFLFHLLTLPLGTVCKLLKEQNMVGCLENLYDSVETLSQTYLQTNQKIDTLLNPKLVSFCNSTMLLPYTHSPPLPKSFYVCSQKNNYDCYDNYHTNCGNYSDDPEAVCPRCNLLINQKGTYVKRKEVTEEEEGYVMGVVSYIVMDDLTVFPMSTISSITDLLNKFNIKDVAALEEKLITLDVNKGVELLKASLQSKTALTDVFFGRTLTTPEISSSGKKKNAPKVMSRGKKRNSRK